MRKNEAYYEMLDEVFMNGKKKELYEIKKEAVLRFGEDFDPKKLENTLYRMKYKGILKQTKDGKYYKAEEDKEAENKTEEKEMKKTSKYDFSKFVQIKESGRKETEEIFSVWTNGEISLNAKLLKHFPENGMSIQLSQDGLAVALFLHGEEMINVGKSGRVKNYDMQKKLKAQKKNFPVYYVGEWDEEEKLWYGKYIPYNPNKGEKQLKK